jgi:hypothetical protein
MRLENRVSGRRQGSRRVHRQRDLREPNWRCISLELLYRCDEAIQEWIDCHRKGLLRRRKTIPFRGLAEIQSSMAKGLDLHRACA